MSKKTKPKLVIKVGDIQVEGSAPLDAGEQILVGFLKALRNIRRDLNSQGIETTVTIAGVTLDEDESEAPQ